MKALVGAFNKEKALVGAFSVISQHYYRSITCIMYYQMFTLLLVTSGLLFAVVAGFLAYRHIVRTLNDNKLREALEGNEYSNLL